MCSLATNYKQAGKKSRLKNKKEKTKAMWIIAKSQENITNDRQDIGGVEEFIYR